MKPFPTDKIHHVVCHECKSLHETIIKNILQLLDDPTTHKSHFFHGRYENIYIDPEKIPSIKPVLKMIQQESARLLDISEDELQLGFWINFMQKDDVTTAHSHDDDDELLSGTYYLQMPENSGELRIKQDNGSIEIIKPEGAALTFFHPSVEHEVSVHKSPIPRISLGFNIGRKRNELPD
jgi:hypothetical protein